MPIDKALRALAAELEEPPTWPRPICPSCDAGHIGFAEPERLEAGASKSARDHPVDFWEPFFIHGTFVVRGRCENPGCEQVMLVSGSYRVNYAKKTAPKVITSYDDEWAHYYHVKSIYPAPILFRMPEGTPDEVVQGVKRASRVLFTDPGLAATALRSAVEVFLTAQGVAAKTRAGRWLNLEHRIEAWKADDDRRSTTAELLLAVKWLGNSGTHEDSDLVHSDVLEGAAVLDEALHRAYTGPDLEAKARGVINKYDWRADPNSG